MFKKPNRAERRRAAKRQTKSKGKGMWGILQRWQTWLGVASAFGLGLLWWGVEMSIASTPHNGHIVTLLGLLVVAGSLLVAVFLYGKNPKAPRLAQQFAGIVTKVKMPVRVVAVVGYVIIMVVLAAQLQWVTYEQVPKGLIYANNSTFIAEGTLIETNGETAIYSTNQSVIKLINSVIRKIPKR